MSKQIIIIKLGGSVITYKDSSSPKARLNNIQNLARDIKDVYKSGYQIILVHGAGSFGHPLVKKYNLHLGVKTDIQKQACKRTQQQMLKLNNYILKALQKNNISVQTFQPHEFAHQSAGKFQSFNTLDIKKALNHNIIPVLYGDMVEDNKWGGSVLSGDVIVSFLAKKLKASQVIFLSDVDGVFDKNPKSDPDAKLIPIIDSNNYRKVLESLAPSGRADVTGEMRGKIESIKKQLSKVEVIITNGLRQGVLTRHLSGISNGTKLLFY